MSYSTCRPELAAYLVAMGADFPKCTRKARLCEFTFEDDEGGIDYTALEWYIKDENAAQVSGPKFFRALQKLRREIYNLKENANANQ